MRKRAPDWPGGAGSGCGRIRSLSLRDLCGFVVNSFESLQRLQGSLGREPQSHEVHRAAASNQSEELRAESRKRVNDGRLQPPLENLRNDALLGVRRLPISPAAPQMSPSFSFFVSVCSVPLWFNHLLLSALGCGRGPRWDLRSSAIAIAARCDERLGRVQDDNRPRLEADRLAVGRRAAQPKRVASHRQVMAHLPRNTRLCRCRWIALLHSMPGAHVRSV